MNKQLNPNLVELKEIFLSIKPKFARLISTREKTYEFRKYKPRKQVRKIWIYITLPEGALKYIAEVGEPIEYPAKILENGIGNSEFNKGLKVSKFAFPILHIDELIEGIPLEQLRKQFNFNPPQSYVYTDKFPELVGFVKNCKIKRLY